MQVCASHQLEVVVHGSETQLQFGEELNEFYNLYLYGLKSYGIVYAKVYIKNKNIVFNTCLMELTSKIIIIII